MTVRAWDSNTVEQFTSGSLLPSSAKPHNVFAEDPAVLNNSPVYILNWTLAANEDFYLQTVTGWGDVDGVWRVLVNSNFVGGGRTSAASPTLLLNYGAGHIKLSGGDNIKVEFEFYTTGPITTRPIKVNLGGGLVTGN